MIALLMYRDRDFDPRQLLPRRERELRHRNTDQKDLALQQLLPWNEEATCQDLGLDVLLTAMAGEDNFLFEVAKVAVLSSLSDVDEILYRQRIYADCAENAGIVREMYRIAMAAIEGERKNYWSYFARYPAGILHHAVELLEIFVGALRRLRCIADEHGGKFKSEGFSRLFSMLRDELSDEYFGEIENHLRRLKFRSGRFPTGVLISARLGKGNKGRNETLRAPLDDDRSWLARLVSETPPSYSFRLHPRDEAGARALATLNDRGVNLVANALAQSTDHILGFFQMLRTELAFYIGSLNLHSRLAEMGEPLCCPAPAPSGTRKLSFSDLHDVSLSLSMKNNVVGNDLKADHKEIFVITGANTGGKSTFLRSIGLAYLMMQAGMFVSARSFASEVCEGVFTHYRREEDAGMESGKWDEELKRMSEIADHIRPNSLLLLNESLASTNEREGSEIAGQIVQALMERKVKIFFVTHLYHFASRFSGARFGAACFLRAERRPDGSRPYKLIEAAPLQTSYGVDLYSTMFADSGKAHVAREETKPAQSLSK
jgi:MutS domain V